MKAFGWLVLLLCFAHSALAEIDTLWTRHVDLDQNAYSLDAATLLTNGETMTAASGAVQGEVMLWRFDVDGNQVWSASIPVAESFVTVLAIEQLRGNRIMMAMIYWSQQDSSSHLIVRLIDENGVSFGQRDYRMYSTDVDPDLVALADGGAAFFMTSYGINSPGTAMLMRFDAQGDTLFTRNYTFDGQYESYGRGLAEFNNGDLLLCGSYGGVQGIYTGFVIRTTPNGSPIWTEFFEGEDQSGLHAMCVDIDAAQNIVVGGFRGFLFWFNMPWAVGLTPNGDLRWTLSGLDNTTFSCVGVRTQSDGGAVLMGTSFADFGFDQIAVHVVDGGGVANPNSEYSCSNCQFRSVNNDGGRGAIAYGRIVDQSWQSDGFLMRFGPNTTVTGFVRSVGTNQPVEGVRVELVETGEFGFSDAQGIYSLAVGQVSGTLRVSNGCITPHQQTVTLIEGQDNEINFSVGIPEFENGISSLNMVVTFGMWDYDTLTVYNNGTGALSFATVAVEQSPTYDWLSVSPASGEIPPNSSAQIIIGVGANPEFPFADLFGEVRIHTNSCPDSVAEIGVFVLALDSPERPHGISSFELHPAYPNPFNASTRIAFDLPQPSNVIAVLYNLQGREVQTLVNGRYESGTHVVNFDGANLATGVYLLRLNAGVHNATQKLVLLK